MTIYASLTSETKKSNERICIVGNNAKSVAAAMALTHFGLEVTLFGFSKTTNERIQRYSFDKPLIRQWQRSLEKGSLEYHCYENSIFTEQSYKHYWLFLDRLPSQIDDTVLNHISGLQSEVCLSGITAIGRINELATSLDNVNVFYIPFVFLNQASIYNATIKPSFVLIGEKTPTTARRNKIVSLFIDAALQAYIDDLKTIEFTRSSMINLMAAKLSLMNEMARLADYYGVDIKRVEKILAQDERMGKGFLQAGWGYGGSTLPKENAILINSLSEAHLSTNIINEVAHINEDQKELIFRKFWRYFDSYIDNKTVLIWGAGYKADTGRTKGSAIHTLLPLLWSHDITTYLYDPLAKDELNRIYENDDKLVFVDTAYDNLAEIDALFVINWNSKDFVDVDQLNVYCIPVFDAINLFTKTQIEQLDAHYTGIGRGIL